MPTLDWLNRAHAFTTAAQMPDGGGIKFLVDKFFRITMLELMADMVMWRDDL
jgi:hypothetical protein